MKSLLATIVVFEKKPRWIPELKRQFRDDDVRIHGTATLADELLVQPGPINSMLVVVLEEAEANCLQFLGRSAQRVDPPPAIVVADPTTMEMEWTIRELGAVDVVADRVTGEELADLCRRVLGRVE